jgi:ComF family protein
MLDDASPVRSMSPPWLSSLRGLLQPACAVCSLAAGPVCADCEADFFPAERPRCIVCAVAVTGGPVCGRCLGAPPLHARATALGDYASPVDGMVLALKFGARLDLARVFGRMLAQRLRPAPDALVVPVPLAHERLVERGFNQAQQIARAYCSATGARLAAGAVRRIRHAPPQQGLSLAERRRNIRGAFEAGAVVHGRAVYVVDDVMTSGSTMDEMARVLLAAGAASVHALVVARTA